MVDFSDFRDNRRFGYPHTAILMVLHRYKITGNTLTVKCGYFPAVNHDISLIATIKPTRTILSAPASSLDRIEIRFVNHSSVVISPYDKLKFINHLRSINPDIDISSFRQE